MPSDDLYVEPDSAAFYPAEPHVSRDHNCDLVIDQFADYLANELSPANRHNFVKEIRKCSLCHDKLLALELVIFLEAESGKPDDELSLMDLLTDPEDETVEETPGWDPVVSVNEEVFANQNFLGD